MSDKLLEQVSSLLDDELPSEQAALLLARLKREPELRERFARYALIGETLRGRTMPVDLGARVASAIAEEPAHAVSGMHRWVSRLRPVAGLAVAASVAMFAVLALQPPETRPPSEVVPALTPASRAVIRPQQAGFSGVRSPELQTQLQRYLMNHNEHADTARLRGVMPYVQIAANDTVRQAAEGDEDSARSPKDAE